MADKESNQRRSTRQERPLYQAGPKNEQRSKLAYSRDNSASSATHGTPPAPIEAAEKVDPMEAVGKKLAEMSMRGPPGYVNRSSSDKVRNYQNRPYANNNNTKNNNQQINNYTTNNNRTGNHHPDDFSRHHSTDSLNGANNAGGRFNTFQSSKDNWNSRANGRSNDRHLSMPSGGFHERGSRNDEGRNSFQGENHRNFNSGSSHFESDRLRGNQSNYDGVRSDRYRDQPARHSESNDYPDRNDRQGNWRSAPRQNDGGSWRRNPNSQQGDFHRGFRDNHRRLLNGSRDSLHSISSARSNDSRMKRGSPVNHHPRNQSRNPSESAADCPKNWIEDESRRTTRDEDDLTGNESQNHGPNDQAKRNDRPRRERRRRSKSQNKKNSRPELREGSRQQEPHESAEQSSSRRDWSEMADQDPVQESDSHEERPTSPPQPEPVEPEVAEITEKAAEKPSRIDWTECPTPPPLEDVCAPTPIREPTPEPPVEVEVKISTHPEESWRNPRSRQTSESSSGQISNCSGFRQWDRQRDGRNQNPRGGRRSPPRDELSYSSFHRRPPSPGSRYQESRDRRPSDRYGNSQGKRYSTFQDSLPPRFRKQKENRV